jgi:G3E family GTPase
MAPVVSIVTGFLGSGKTTLLRALLQRGLAGRRVALIVNEIGEVGFDGRAVEGLGYSEMVELTGGCICCALGSEFLLAVEELIDVAEPDLILIETTGLAEPASMARQIRAADLPLDSVVAVADAVNLEAALSQSVVAAWQLRAADFVVLAKADLVSPARLAEAEALVRGHNGRAAIFPARSGDLDWRLVFGAGPSGASLAAELPPLPDHLAADGFAARVWRGERPVDRTRFERALAAMPPALYRLKGHVFHSDAPWPSLVNFVCGRADVTATRFRTPPAHLNELVLIGRFGGEEASLLARLDACMLGSAEAEAWRSKHDLYE